jgi:hypothetical protein
MEHRRKMCARHIAFGGISGISGQLFIDDPASFSIAFNYDPDAAPSAIRRLR